MFLLEYSKRIKTMLKTKQFFQNGWQSLWQNGWQEWLAKNGWQEFSEWLAIAVMFRGHASAGKHIRINRYIGKNKNNFKLYVDLEVFKFYQKYS